MHQANLAPTQPDVPELSTQARPHVIAMDLPFLLSWISILTGLVMAIDSPLLLPAAAPAGELLPTG